jgi:two-component system NtrC family sensor kinase
VEIYFYFFIGIITGIFLYWIALKYLLIPQKKEKETTSLGLESPYTVIGELTSGLMHDMGNPLATINLSLESLQGNLAHKDELKSKNELLIERAKRALQVVQNLIAIIQKQIKSQTDEYFFLLRPVLEEASFLIEFRRMEQGISVDITCDSNLGIVGNPLSFARIITNLLANACDAYGILQTTKRNTAKSISIKVEDKDEMLYITVQDWASGVADIALDDVLVPLKTTKTIDKGTGVGLTLCRKIVESEFSGVIELDSKKGQGTTVVVTIPKKL